MSSSGPRLNVAFGVGGTAPEVRSKLGSVSLDQRGPIGSEGFRGSLPAGRKSFYFQNDGESQATITLYANPDGTTFVRAIIVPAGEAVMVPLGADINFFYTAGSGTGRALVLQ